MDNEKYQTQIKTEGRLSTLETLVGEIKDNHLPHIEAKVDRITWLLVTTLGGVVATLFLK